MTRTQAEVPDDLGASDSTLELLQAGEPSSERAYRVLKAAIVDGSLAPGATVSEQQLARRLEMSRTPVHQAVSRLEADGWVTVAARSGVRISPLVADDLADIYETLLALEGVAAARLARLSTDAINEQLLIACVRCEEALAANDLRAWAEWDNALHTVLVDACGNQRLRRAFQTVAEQAHRARMLTVELRPFPVNSNRDHRVIVDAIIGHRPAEARKALESHRMRGMETLLPIIRALVPGSSSFV